MAGESTSAGGTGGAQAVPAVVIVGAGLPPAGSPATSSSLPPPPPPPSPPPPPASSLRPPLPWWAEWFAGPARLLVYGLVIAGLVALLNWVIFGSVAPAGRLVAVLGGNGGDGLGMRQLVVAALIFFVGIAFAGYLWWLSARYFGAIREMSADKVAALKDLPMALPEGTVRAVIALIVGVVGLPILVFSRALDLNESIAGYINGIVTGVFAYYFGTRSANADAQTARASVKIADAAQAEAQKLREENGALGNVVTAVRGAAEIAGSEALNARVETNNLARKSSFDTELDRLNRQLKAARGVTDLLADTLPQLLPPGASDAIAKAGSVLDAAQALRGDGVTEDSLKKVADAARELLGKSPLPGLIEKAAGVLPLMGALPPAAGVLLVLGLGWRLGSEQYQRWIARVLDAPYNPRLIDAGYFTGASARLCLQQAPIFARVFATEIETQPQFANELLDLALRENGSDAIWQRWGGETRFASRGEASDGLMEFRSLLLAERGRADIDAAKLGEVVSLLPAASAAPTLDDVNAAFDAGARRAQGSDEQRGAFDALVLLTGQLREARIDPVPLLAEVLPK